MGMNPKNYFSYNTRKMVNNLIEQWKMYSKMATLGGKLFL